MSESYSKIFLWQLAIAAVVGIVWAVLWEISPSETGFSFDLSVGLFLGFLVGALALVVLGVIAGGIWAAVGMGKAGGLNEAMSVNLDRMTTSPPVEWVNATLDSINASGVGMAIEWALKVALVWGMAGGIVWWIGPSFVLGLVVVLLVGFGGAVAIVWMFEVADTLAANLGQGYDWLPVSGLMERWESWGLVSFWGFAGALAWGIGGALAAGGLGAGIVQAIVLGLAALIAAGAGGFVGVQLKKSA